MILFLRAYHVSPRLRACIELFEQHQRSLLEYALLRKILIQRKGWLREWPFQYRRTLNEESFPKPSESFSESFNPTSDTLFQVTVTSTPGLHKAFFYGTRSQVYSEIALYLMTGKSGTTSQERSSRDSRRKVLSLLSSEMPPDLTPTKSTSSVTESYVRATHPHEEYGQARRLSPEAGSSQPSTQDSWNSPWPPSTGT